MTCASCGEPIKPPDPYHEAKDGTRAHIYCPRDLGLTTECPFCHGKPTWGLGCGPGTSRMVVIPCRACLDVGKVTAERARQLVIQRQQGEEIRRDRIARRVSQRDAAREHGMDVVRYSHVEFGYEAAPWLG